jgi:hypothetical protein
MAASHPAFKAIVITITHCHRHQAVGHRHPIQDVMGPSLSYRIPACTTSDNDSDRNGTAAETALSSCLATAIASWLVPLLAAQKDNNSVHQSPSA